MFVKVSFHQFSDCFPAFKVLLLSHVHLLCVVSCRIWDEKGKWLSFVETG